LTKNAFEVAPSFREGAIHSVDGSRDGESVGGWSRLWIETPCDRLVLTVSVSRRGPANAGKAAPGKARCGFTLFA
jgi:hypothetical protein